MHGQHNAPPRQIIQQNVFEAQHSPKNNTLLLWENSHAAKKWYFMRITHAKNSQNGFLLNYTIVNSHWLLVKVKLHEDSVTMSATKMPRSCISSKSNLFAIWIFICRWLKCMVISPKCWIIKSRLVFLAVLSWWSIWLFSSRAPSAAPQILS